MAINFEAANMAGYNNPKIEVFRARSSDMTTLDEAPSITDILNCINRGTIPYILLNVADSYHILIPFSAFLIDPELGVSVSFSFENVVLEGAAPLVARIIYPFDDKPPLFTFTIN